MVVNDELGMIRRIR